MEAARGAVTVATVERMKLAAAIGETLPLRERPSMIWYRRRMETRRTLISLLAARTIATACRVGEPTMSCPACCLPRGVPIDASCDGHLACLNPVDCYDYGAPPPLETCK